MKPPCCRLSRSGLLLCALLITRVSAFVPSSTRPLLSPAARRSMASQAEARSVKGEEGPTWPSFSLPPELTGWLAGLGGPKGGKAVSSKSVKDESRTAEAERLKSKLKRMVAPTNRGFSANTTQRIELIREVEKLEALNPTAVPVESPDVSCAWSVLYAGPIDVKMDKKKQELAYVYGPVLSKLKDLIPKGLIKAKGEFQVIDASKGSLTNIATFTLFDKYQGRFEIDGTAVPVPPRRFNVTFTDGRLSIGDVKLNFSLRLLNPTGWVDVTYLDENFRLTRGDKGSIFVVARVKSDAVTRGYE